MRCAAVGDSCAIAGGTAIASINAAGKNEACIDRLLEDADTTASAAADRTRVNHAGRFDPIDANRSVWNRRVGIGVSRSAPGIDRDPCTHTHARSPRAADG
ncbi:hypothetical protein GCM10007067_16080 [Lysobacter bugurensis]|uniref:Uncharacterized protein n=1 Tax=Cognatilysobacter bugurensis TaxID=543356 RepID=A0A918SYY4_9GAMM|nr:hypothetical protein GCM10007067_16080 [Lysobacter bugurensis]